ncbi:MAG: heteromeric transposase endonuclease subunit TnsA [Chloroflexota bacterium]|nr:heteromeric transposase endonuclease subunit TnsA [Chloroflexota bacterium]
MLSEQGLVALCADLNIGYTGGKILQEIRKAEPARRVRSRFGKAAMSYASTKMGVSIQAADNLAIAYVITSEHDGHTLEFYDQPEPIPLSYRLKNGRTAAIRQAADFFVVRDDGCAWVKLWDAAKLEQEAEKHPTRYKRDADGRWHDLAGEAYAAPHGLGYRLVTSGDIDPMTLRNTSFLSEYLQHDRPEPSETVAEEIRSFLEAEPGMFLADLLDHLKGATSDDVFTLIASERIYVDLAVVPLAEPTFVRCFRDRRQAELHRIVEAGQLDAMYPKLRIIRREQGEIISWDGQPRRILNVGETTITLANQENVEHWQDLPLTVFNDLVQQGKITGLAIEDATGYTEKGRAVVRQATPQAEAEAVKRDHILELEEKRRQGIPLTTQEERELASVSDRTRRRWRRRRRQADFVYGNPQLGLIPDRDKQGNRTPRFGTDYIRILFEFLKRVFFSGEQPTIEGKYTHWNGDCLENGRPPMGRKTFGKYVDIAKTYENQQKRHGHRGAYDDKPIALFFWLLDLRVPPHGEYPMHIAHIDHTQLDLECRCSRTGKNLGRPWATFLVCARTRRILAIYLSYDPPSYRSNMMVLRMCVKRWGRLPAVIVADGGKDFQSTYFEQLLKRYKVSLRIRPPAEARFGNVLERLFGTTNTQFIHQLMGNTKVMKRELRKVTKHVDPKELARWPLGILFETLCEWGFEVYDVREHSSLLESPRAAFTRGIAQGGARKHMKIEFNNDFIFDTLPTTDSGKARIQWNKGVKINGAYYGNPHFKRREFAGLDVPVKYDPWNYGIAYVYIRKTAEGKDVEGQHGVIGWIECRSRHHDAFRGLTKRQIEMLTEELRRLEKLHHKVITDDALARFVYRVMQRQKQLDQEWVERWGSEGLRTVENQDVIRAVMGELGGSAISGNQPVPQGVADADTDVEDEDDLPFEQEVTPHATTLTNYGTF